MNGHESPGAVRRGALGLCVHVCECLDLPGLGGYTGTSRNARGENFSLGCFCKSFLETLFLAGRISYLNHVGVTTQVRKTFIL